MKTKNIIKQVVLDLLKTRNIYEITAQMVADNVGIKKPSIFHHFSTMDILFKESLMQAFDESPYEIFQIAMLQLHNCTLFPKTVKAINILLKTRG